MRADQGPEPVTLGIDIGVIKTIITHAAAVHGLDISPEPVDLARVALKRLGLIGKGTERDRRPTIDELHARDQLLVRPKCSRQSAIPCDRNMNISYTRLSATY